MEAYEKFDYMYTMTSGTDSMGHGVTSPNFYKWLGTRGTVSRRTAKKTDQTVLTISKALTQND